MLVSRHLENMTKSLEGRVSLGEIVHSMRHSGFGLVLIFLCLPFLQPVPMAGLSTALGLVIGLLAIQMVLKRNEVWLPKFLQKKELNEETGKALLSAAAKFFKFIEVFVRPRLSFLARSERMMGVIIFISAFLLALPIPIPFSNMFCAVPIVLLAISLLEKDGFFALLGIVGLLLSLAFHIAIFFLGFEGLKLLWERVVA